MGTRAWLCFAELDILIYNLLVWAHGLHHSLFSKKLSKTLEVNELTQIQAHNSNDLTAQHLLRFL